MRPRGNPPMPSAMSRASAPVGIDSMFMCRFSPMRMIEPFPNCFSIWPKAASRAFARSSVAITFSLFLLTRGTLGTCCDIGRAPPFSGYYEQVFVTGIFKSVPRTSLPGPPRSLAFTSSYLIDQCLIDQLLQITTYRVGATGQQLGVEADGEVFDRIDPEHRRRGAAPRERSFRDQALVPAPIDDDRE